MLLTPRLKFLIEYLDLPAATGDPTARWELFQAEHLNNDSLFAIEDKSRQVGWSFLTAAEAVAESILEKRSTTVFMSINQDEATEKIRYAQACIEALPNAVKPKVITNNRMELEIENGSRLISHPCRPLRGKARVKVYLDEFAHYPRDREIYTSVVPVVTKGGRLRIGSSPLGAQGMFWEIFEQKIRPYPGYKRRLIPWWAISSLCKNVPQALKLAGVMLTDERVRLFGTSRLIEIYENMMLEDFQQEYECAWVDESVSWITWDEIKRNQFEAQAGSLWYRQARSVDDALIAIDELAQAIHAGLIESVLAAGADIGRKHDLTELTFLGSGVTAQRPYRLGISLSKVEFEKQRAVFDKALRVLPISLMLIDQNGLGMQLSEQLHATHGDRAQGVDFTNASKALWAGEAKVQMQRGAVPIPIDRDLSYQIHSIKKMITPAKNVVFDTSANEKHHADKFWSLALGLWAAREQGPKPASSTAKREVIHARKPKSSWQN